MDKLDLIRRYETYVNYIWSDVINKDWSLDDFLNKDDEGNYEENIYINDDNDYEELVKICFELKDKIKSHLYNVDGTMMIELSDNHTLFDIHNENFDYEEYQRYVDDKLTEFHHITEVPVWQAGRMGRHIVVCNELENAYRFDELCNVQQRLENELIDEMNSLR